MHWDLIWMPHREMRMLLHATHWRHPLLIDITIDKLALIILKLLDLLSLLNLGHDHIPHLLVRHFSEAGLVIKTLTTHQRCIW
jgi:hypothetical protein